MEFLLTWLVINFVHQHLSRMLDRLRLSADLILLQVDADPDYSASVLAANMFLGSGFGASFLFIGLQRNNLLSLTKKHVDVVGR